MERQTKSLAVVGRSAWYMRWLMRVKVPSSSTKSTLGGKGRGGEGVRKEWKRGGEPGSKREMEEK